MMQRMTPRVKQRTGDPLPPKSQSADQREEEILARFLADRAQKQQARNERGKMYRQYSTYSGKALEIPLAVVVGVVLGSYADSHFGIAPWGTAGGLFLGGASAVRSVILLVQHYQKTPAVTDKEADHGEHSSGSGER